MAENSWGTVNSNNYQKKCQETKKYKPFRLQLSKEVKYILQNNLPNLIWFIDNGTLLAAYRDQGKMLPHDDDFDISFLGDQQDFELIYLTLQKFLNKKYKVRKIHNYCKKIQVYEPEHGSYNFGPDDIYDYCNVTVDLQMYKLSINKTVQIQYWKDNLNQKFKPKYQFIVPTSTLVFEGITFPVPGNTKAHLQQLYGYLGRDCKYDKTTSKYVKI